MSQMLNEHDAIMTHDGRLALCIRAYDPAQRRPYPPKAQTQEQWAYDMFDEGRVFCMTNDDVKEELSSGGHVIVMDI